MHPTGAQGIGTFPHDWSLQIAPRWSRGSAQPTMLRALLLRSCRRPIRLVSPSERHSAPSVCRLPKAKHYMRLACAQSEFQREIHKRVGKEQSEVGNTHRASSHPSHAHDGIESDSELASDGTPMLLMVHHLIITTR